MLAALAFVSGAAAQSGGLGPGPAGSYGRDGGATLSDIVKKALDSNGEIKIAKFELEKAKARLLQAGLRRNPTLQVEQDSGALAGSPGNWQFSAGVSMPLDLYGLRQRRIEQAQAEVSLKEAEIAVKQRDIISRIVADHADALSAYHEMKVLDEMLAVNLETIRFVQIQVNEGETAPLELSLLQTEVERLRVQRQLVESRLQSALIKLRYFAAIPYEQPLRLRDELPTATFPSLPPSVDTAVDIGMRNRPEIRLAEFEEQLARAGSRSIRAEARPEVAAFTKFSVTKATIDLPLGPYPQNREQGLQFGVTIGLPIFDKKQGAIAEAEIAARQAQEKRAMAEALIRNEIVLAFQQLEAARRALISLETNVLPRSRENLETFRNVYKIGQIKITDLLTEQRKLIDANKDLNDAFTRKYRAEASLFAAIGLTFEN